MRELLLGKSVNYPTTYDAALLQAVPRSMSRDNLGIKNENLPFGGIDIWNAYEVSWLSPKFKPQIAILECRVPVDSPNLIESKSFKLYLNSFNQSCFESEHVVLEQMTKDLSACAGMPVVLSFLSASNSKSHRFGDLEGESLDVLDITFDPEADITPELLTTGTPVVKETLTSELLKSNCLITNQPDWGSVVIKYKGHKIHREGLLKYIVSFRNHNEFHEQCVERIFHDILHRCNPELLTVYARYTRRGGLDINPFRSNFEAPYPNTRLPRQ